MTPLKNRGNRHAEAFNFEDVKEERCSQVRSAEERFRRTNAEGEGNGGARNPGYTPNRGK